MFNINQFISDFVTHRKVSMFAKDIEANKLILREEIAGKSLCVIGGAGSIGSSFIKEMLKYEPGSLFVFDLNENGLAELARDIRSTNGLFCPKVFKLYTLDFANPIFERIFMEEHGFDIVANFSAHKHVRSEKDKYSVEALIENNDIKAKKLMDLLTIFPPKHFFCVSTDKAANPVNIMGASKKIMEELVMSYRHLFNVTTARFANVAFSNGSLPDSWLHRIQKKQAIAAPVDVKRYFVSPEESGQICMLACVLGNSGEIFFPKLKEEQMLTFSSICDHFLSSFGYKKLECESETSAKEKSINIEEDDKLYPVIYFNSDTTGEKSYEEFYVEGEKIDNDRYISLGVVKNDNFRQLADINLFFEQINNIFKKKDFTKEEIVYAIKQFLPNFEHEEKGKNLDQKM